MRNTTHVMILLKKGDILIKVSPFLIALIFTSWYYMKHFKMKDNS